MNNNFKINTRYITQYLFTFLIIFTFLSFNINSKFFEIIISIEIVKIFFMYIEQIIYRILKFSINSILIGLEIFFIFIFISSNIYILTFLLLALIIVNTIIFEDESIYIGIILIPILSILEILSSKANASIFLVILSSILGLLFKYFYQSIKIQKITPTEDLTKNNLEIDEFNNTSDIKDEFTIIVSHNLRTPVATIRGYLQLIEYTKDEELKKNYFNLLNNNVNKLYSLVEEVLDIIDNTKKDTKIKTNVSLIISEIIERMDPEINSKRIVINKNFESQQIEVAINDSKLKIIISNILDNAIKYSHLNSSIDITLKTINNVVSIGIKDYGTGIGKEEMENIFSKYHKSTNVLNSNFEGFGLGLYIVKNLINEEKGKINISSEKDKGTEVEILFPL